MTTPDRGLAPVLDPVAHGRSAETACSVLWDRVAASAFGTASEAHFWVAFEQSGPWGHDAARQSHLGEELGGRLTEACAAAGGRFILIRQPGLHADHRAPQSHRCYFAWSGEDPWLLSGTVANPASLLDAIDWLALARGDRPTVIASWFQRTVGDAGCSSLEVSPPALLVCTNAKRDVCCAVRGRPVALAAAAARPGRVWECSHTGGHRFAPTGVLLPHGQTLARLHADLAVEAVDAAVEAALPLAALGPAHDRGRSALSAPAQAAESLIRHEIGETALTALSTTLETGSDDETWGALVVHRDGRTWCVAVHREQGPYRRPSSCGKTAGPVVHWQMTKSTRGVPTKDE